jgi:hypothetical protein
VASDDGIDVRLAGETVIRGLRVRPGAGTETAAGPAAGGAVPGTVETPLGLERRLGERWVERLVVSRDAPVAWLEWTPDEAGAAIEVHWRVPVGAGGLSAREREGRSLRVVHGDGFRAIYVLGVEPDALEVTEADRALAVRVRAAVPADGLRLAVVGAGPDDDPGRLLRIAGRPQVAVRGREAAARRVLDDGLRVASPDPDLDQGVARAVIGYDATRLPDSGAIAAVASEALARLAAGDFATVHAALRTRAGFVDDDATDGDPGRLFLLLVGHYLAWSGDVNGTRSLWPAAVETPGAPDRAAAGPVGTLVYDYLGARPDAPRGRVVLRPRLPEDWDRLDVRGLAVGSAALDVAYRREAGVHRFRTEQTRGPAPLQLVLAPELAGSGRIRARVDGTPADLEPGPARGRRRVPVQLVLDRPRTLEVEVSPDSV